MKPLGKVRRWVHGRWVEVTLCPPAVCLGALAWAPYERLPARWYNDPEAPKPPRNEDHDEVRYREALGLDVPAADRRLGNDFVVDGVAGGAARRRGEQAWRLAQRKQRKGDRRFIRSRQALRPARTQQEGERCPR